MISAQEARKLAGPSVQDRVDEIAPLIKKAAEAKKRSVALHDSFWVHEGYNSTPEYVQATDMLKELGYKVSFYYKEHSIAVDMYTVVEW